VNKPKREEMISFAIIEKDGLSNNGTYISNQESQV
jgi:hypothetical protein